MNQALLIILAFLSFNVFGQKVIKLEEFAKGDQYSNEYALIYGNFIQRLGFSSGGYPQEICLMNEDTKDILVLRVKPAFKTAKENAFFYRINPGKYFILSYRWTQSEPLGATFYTEPIFKGYDSSSEDFHKKLKSGEINVTDLPRYSFVISGNDFIYLGTWHFDKGIVSFTEDKTQLDIKVSAKYKTLDFTKAIVIIPN